MSAFWSIYIIVLVAVMIVGCFLLLHYTKSLRGDEDADGKVKHSYDGIEEYNKPLPRWWLWMFYATLVFSIGYLVFYPGLGSFSGTLGWTSSNELAADNQASDAKIQPLYDTLNKKSVAELAQDKQAQAIGSRLFAGNCAVCHGSDAKGAPGFPNLTDKDWLYGGEPETIEQTILNGRGGAMPAFGAALDDKLRLSVKHYVLSLSGGEHDTNLARNGKSTFDTICAACHGPDGHGNQQIGAPNLTDEIWLYGGTHGAIDETLKNGRNGRMPAHAQLLGPDKVHVLAAYVYSLSQQP